jgi:uridine kinase
MSEPLKEHQTMTEISNISVRDAEADPSIQVHLPDGKVLEGPRGIQLEVFVKQLDTEEAPIVGGIVNGELRELTYPIEMESRIRPVTMAEEDGMRIYRRSLTFLLAAAFEELFPHFHLTVDHSITSGGYHCQVSGRDQLGEDELRRLEQKMEGLVEQDLPFAKVQMPLEEAIAYFREKAFQDKARLLSRRKKPYMMMYRLGNHQDYHHGYMVPSTGYLRWFSLSSTEYGFTLRFPQRSAPNQLLPSKQFPKMLAAFRRYGDWLSKLGISSIGALNDAIEAGRAHEVILVSEAFHERYIAEIALTIAELIDSLRVILIAGPSSSGKTTFSKRLSVQLLSLGISPFTLELDNFFIDREKTPKDEHGDYDYEVLQALDLERLNHDLKSLSAGKAVRLPRYDFISGKHMEGDAIQLHADQIIILEGIHGMNPELLPEISSKQTFRIYVSALTQLNLDRYNRVSTTDTRLVRRIVRDAKHRGYSAMDTIRRWESVRRGEKKYIFPFQGNADVMFNSALAYEGSALSAQAEPLLRQVTFGTPEHVEAKRLLSLLEWFLPLDTSLIPDNSILREFVGESILKDFKLWRPVQAQG